MTASKAGTHPLIVKYNEKLEEMSKSLRQIDEEINAEYKLSKFPEPIYKLIGHYEDKYQGSEGTRFVIELQNSDEYRAYMDVWGQGKSGIPQDKMSSVSYIYVNGLILHRGGGNLIFGEGFNDPFFASPEEWASLLALKVPDRIKEQSKYYKYV
jgi:hypothetical protein